MKTAKQNPLFHWSIGFLIGNIFLCWIAGINYLRSVSWLESHALLLKIKIFTAFFAIFSYLSQLTLLVCVPGIFILLLARFTPWRSVVFVSSILLGALTVNFVTIDAFVYRMYHFHINGVVLDFILHAFGQSLFDLSRYEIGRLIFLFCSIFLIEIIYAYGLWQYIQKKSLPWQKIKWFALSLTLCVYISYSMIFLSLQVALGRVLIDTSRVFPFYTQMLNLMLLTKKSSQYGIERFSETALIQAPQAYAPLQYPLHPLQCKEAARPKNLLIIGIDTWRFDVLNQATMPAVTEFAKKSWQFTHHFSGGNSTGPGIFSLFYGLPSTYWTSMERQHQGPLLIDELIHQHYTVTSISSATMLSPPFQRTVFRSIPNLFSLQQPGETPYERDQSVTQKFTQFVQQVHQPFFAFLFYDSAHGYCSLHNVSKPFQPAVEQCVRSDLMGNPDPLPYFNRYKNAVYLLDHEIKKVLDMLKKQHLLDNTIVIITGDHGEEFNDNHMGYWHHAGNFTQYQVQTPLIVYWPGEKPRIFSHQTDHFDIAPTLMKSVLGCRNEAADYSLGMDLLDKNSRPYRIVGSYIDFGVVEKNRITTIYPQGEVEIDDLHAKPMRDASLNLAVMSHVFRDLRRFYTH